MSRLTLEERFWAKVDASAGPDGCWLWAATQLKGGYGQFNVNGRKTAAHRFAYELLVGPIPDGLEVDHVRKRGCDNTLCVNPAHLEPVTHRENLLRADTFQARNAAKTHCVHGHPFDEANTYVEQTPLGDKRRCRACGRERQKRYMERRTRNT